MTTQGYLHPKPPQSNGHFKRLTPTEVQDKIKKRKRKKCFHCTEPRIPRHKYKTPIIVLLDIDTLDDEPHEFHDCNSKEDTPLDPIFHMLELFFIPSLGIGQPMGLKSSIEATLIRVLIA